MHVRRHKTNPLHWGVGPARDFGPLQKLLSDLPDHFRTNNNAAKELPDAISSEKQGQPVISRGMRVKKAVSEYRISLQAWRLAPHGPSLFGRHDPSRVYSIRLNAINRPKMH